MARHFLGLYLLIVFTLAVVSWGQDKLLQAYSGTDRMLDIRISRLRRKLGDEVEIAERIKTVWGQGYLFVPDAW